MNPEDFEKHLQRQPLRPVPAAWREEILSAARQASAPQPTPHPARRFRPSVLSTLNSQLSTFLWPHPAAWAGLAAIWLVTGGLSLATREAAPQLARRASPLSAEVFIAFHEQEQLLAELLGPREAPEVERPKPVRPRPRSDGRRARLMA
jgi:hypothetical protein